MIVDFPVLAVTHIDGRQIKLFYTYDKDYFVYLFKNTSPFDKNFIVPFLIVGDDLCSFYYSCSLASSGLQLQLWLRAPALSQILFSPLASEGDWRLHNRDHFIYDLPNHSLL